MSITGCVGALIDGCQFLDTNGTPPAAGVDLEPNAGKRVEEIAIQHSSFQRNQGWGLLIGGHGVQHPTVTGNQFDANGQGAVRMVRTRDGVVQGNTINVTAGMAVQFEETSIGNTVSGNVVTENGHPVQDGRLYLETRGAHGNRIERP
jgi:hypothetical protein